MRNRNLRDVSNSNHNWRNDKAIIFKTIKKKNLMWCYCINYFFYTIAIITNS